MSDVFDPSEATIEEVATHLETADEAERDRVFAAERAGKARKGVLELAPFDPSSSSVADVVAHLEAADDAERERVLEAERAGKARKGVLEAKLEGIGPLGATTTLREDFLGRNIVDPTGVAKDFLGRATTSTADFSGRPLRRPVRAMATVLALGAEVQYPTGEKFVVKTAGTTHATVVPAVPAVGADVTDGTAVLTRQR